MALTVSWVFAVAEWKTGCVPQFCHYSLMAPENVLNLNDLIYEPYQTTLEQLEIP